METNNHQIVDYSAVLEAQYGALGTPERAKFDEEGTEPLCSSSANT